MPFGSLKFSASSRNVSRRKCWRFHNTKARISPWYLKRNRERSSHSEGCTAINDKRGSIAGLTRRPRPSCFLGSRIYPHSGRNMYCRWCDGLHRWWGFCWSRFLFSRGSLAMKTPGGYRSTTALDGPAHDGKWKWKIALRLSWLFALHSRRDINSETEEITGFYFPACATCLRPRGSARRN